jgi:hypothetical protein
LGRAGDESTDKAEEDIETGRGEQDENADKESNRKPQLLGRRTPSLWLESHHRFFLGVGLLVPAWWQITVVELKGGRREGGLGRDLLGRAGGRDRVIIYSSGTEDAGSGHDYK